MVWTRTTVFTKITSYFGVLQIETAEEVKGCRCCGKIPTMPHFQSMISPTRCLHKTKRGFLSPHLFGTWIFWWYVARWGHACILPRDETWESHAIPPQDLRFHMCQLFRSVSSPRIYWCVGTVRATELTQASDFFHSCCSTRLRCEEIHTKCDSVRKWWGTEVPLRARNHS